MKAVKKIHREEEKATTTEWRESNEGKREWEG